MKYFESLAALQYSKDPNKQEVWRLVCLLESSLRDKQENEQGNEHDHDISANAYFISMISLLLLPKVDRRIQLNLCYLMSFILKDVPNHYISQNMELLLPLFIELILEQEKEASWQVGVHLLSALPDLFLSRLYVTRRDAASHPSQSQPVWTACFCRLLGQVEGSASWHARTRLALFQALSAILRSVEIELRGWQALISECLFGFLERMTSEEKKKEEEEEKEENNTNSNSISNAHLNSFLKLFVSCLELKEANRLVHLVLVTASQSHGIIEDQRCKLLGLLLEHFEWSKEQKQDMFQIWLLLEAEREARGGRAEAAAWMQVAYLMACSNGPHLLALVRLVRTRLARASAGGLRAAEWAKALLKGLVNGLATATTTRSEALRLEGIQEALIVLIKERLEEDVEDIGSVDHSNLCTFSLSLLSKLILALGQDCNASAWHPLLISIEHWAQIEKKEKERENIWFAIVASLLTSLGLQVVLTILPLSFLSTSEDTTTSRDWLLPLIKKHITQPSLAFYSSHLLPIAESLLEKIQSATEDTPVSPMLSIRYYQIWSLLPTFVHHAIDFHLVFPKMEKIMMDAMTDPELCSVMAHALVVATRDFGDASGVWMEAGLASRWLALLFGLYQSAPVDRRNYLVEAMRALALVADVSLLQNYLANSAAKLLALVQAGQGGPALLALLDLLAAVLLPAAAERASGLELEATLKRALLAALAPCYACLTDGGVRKRAFKVLAAFWRRAGEGQGSETEMEMEIEWALTFLRHAAAHPSSCKSFYLALSALAHRMAVSHPSPRCYADYLALWMPLMILGLKEVNRVARETCLEALLAFAQHQVESGREQDSDSAASAIESLMAQVMAGLAGRSTHMISATMTALARLTAAHAGRMRPAFYGQMVEMVLSLGSIFSPAPSVRMESTTTLPTESAKAYLEWLRALCLAPAHRECILKALPQLLAVVFPVRTEGTSGLGGALKLKQRHLLQKLMATYGQEIIAKALPLAHHKLMQHIIKSERQQVTSNSASVSNSIPTCTTKGGWSIRQPLEQPLDLLHLSPAALSSRLIPATTPAASAPFPILDGKYQFVDSEASGNESGNEKKSGNETRNGKKKRKAEERGGRVEIGGQGEGEEVEVEVEDEEGDKNKRKKNKKSKNGAKISSQLFPSQYSGQSYAAKKSKGDLKKSTSSDAGSGLGALEPFAYVPLSRQLLASTSAKSRRRQLYHR